VIVNQGNLELHNLLIDLTESNAGGILNYRTMMISDSLVIQK